MSLELRQILKQRGKELFERRIRDTSGVMTLDEVSKFLCLPSEFIQQQVTDNHLLVIPFGDEIRFPCFQFNEHGVITHLEEIMGLLKAHSQVEKVLFYLEYDEDLNDTPIGVLQNGELSKLDLIKLLANQFRQHAAR